MEDIFEARTSFELRFKLLLPFRQDREMQRFDTVWVGSLRAANTSIIMSLSRLFDDRHGSHAGNLRTFLLEVRRLNPRSAKIKRTQNQIDFLNEIDANVRKIQAVWKTLEDVRHAYYAHTSMGPKRDKQYQVEAGKLIDIAEAIHDSYGMSFSRYRPHQDSSLQHDIETLQRTIYRGIHSK